ncbi:hypothetical protein TNCV_4765291 [Trichonephila clavipes]|nr:hypothetical protein TNCV_4765291 [Trichonephila clavipes]
MRIVLADGKNLKWAALRWLQILLEWLEKETGGLLQWEDGNNSWVSIYLRGMVRFIEDALMHSKNIAGSFHLTSYRQPMAVRKHHSTHEPKTTIGIQGVREEPPYPKTVERSPLWNSEKNGCVYLLLHRGHTLLF